MSQPTQACRCVVVSGVAGSGKTTVAMILADLLGWTYAEGDEFHPERNIQRMRAGIALNDADRASWLAAIGAWIDSQVPQHGVVVTCSALRRAYRHVLVANRPWLRIAQLTTADDVLRERLASRADHFMPVSLIGSQLAALEPLAHDEPGVVVTGESNPRAVASLIIRTLDISSDARR